MRRQGALEALQCLAGRRFVYCGRIGLLRHVTVDSPRRILSLASLLRREPELVRYIRTVGVYYSRAAWMAGVSPADMADQLMAVLAHVRDLSLRGDVDILLAAAAAAAHCDELERFEVVSTGAMGAESATTSFCEAIRRSRTTLRHVALAIYNEKGFAQAAQSEPLALLSELRHVDCGQGVHGQLERWLVAEAPKLESISCTGSWVIRDLPDDVVARVRTLAIAFPLLEVTLDLARFVRLTACRIRQLEGVRTVMLLQSLPPTLVELSVHGGCSSLSFGRIIVDLLTRDRLPALKRLQWDLMRLPEGVDDLEQLRAICFARSIDCSGSVETVC